MARYALTHYYPRLSPADMRWVLVEATGRILPEVDLDMAAWTVQQLTARGHGRAPQHPARVGRRPRRWCGSATARSSPATPSSGRRARSPTRCSPRPTCPSTTAAGWSASRRSRCAACRTPGRPATWPPCPTSPRTTPAPRPRPTPSTPSGRPSGWPTTSSPCWRGQEPTPYRHKYAGSVASLGLHKGVAQVYGVKLKGWPAWFMHRTYHVSRVPTFNRKARVVADWTLASVFRREVISLGQLQDPRREFVSAANTGRPGQLPPPPGRPARADGARGRRRGRRRYGQPSAVRSRLPCAARPRSPTGRGRPLKRVPASVRIPTGGTSPVTAGASARRVARLPGSPRPGDLRR